MREKFINLVSYKLNQRLNFYYFRFCKSLFERNGSVSQQFA